MENQQQVALITGGSRGIGRAIVLELARSRWRVALTYRSGQEAAQQLCEELESEGLACFAYPADAKDYSRACEVTKEVEESIGPIDLLVNNAGVKKDGPLYRMSPEDWNEVIQTNLNGTFNYARALLLGMIKRESGNIVNIVSVSGIIGMAGQTNYAASKAGIVGFTRSLSKEVARFNIRVNAIAPGFIETDMLQDIPEPTRKKLFAQIPMGSPGSPEQVAKSVAFLASEHAAYITGQVLSVDGGMT